MENFAKDNSFHLTCFISIWYQTLLQPHESKKQRKLITFEDVSRYSYQWNRFFTKRRTLKVTVDISRKLLLVKWFIHINWSIILFKDRGKIWLDSDVIIHLGNIKSAVKKEFFSFQDYRCKLLLARQTKREKIEVLSRVFSIFVCIIIEILMGVVYLMVT